MENKYSFLLQSHPVSCNKLQIHAAAIFSDASCRWDALQEGLVIKDETSLRN